MPLRRPFLLLAFAVACVLAGLGADALAPAPAQQRAPASPAAAPLYVALGDSLAAGWQPDSQGHDRSTPHGYVDVVARSLARSHPGLRHRTLSCGGATAGTLLNGGAGCQPGGERGQIERAEDLLAASPGTVLVTVNIGDNDIEACIDGNDGTVDRACLTRGEDNLRRNLPQIAARLRAAAPASAPVVGLVDYDQFLSLWLEGPRGRAAARRSLPIILSLNRLVAGIYRKGGLQVADAGARFATGDLTHSRTLPGHGSVPLAVYNICTLTWACSAEPIGHDDHARPRGYYELAQSILDVLRPPG
jgi:lysophospholipase L1-like esterase